MKIQIITISIFLLLFISCKKNEARFSPADLIKTNRGFSVKFDKLTPDMQQLLIYIHEVQGWPKKSLMIDCRNIKLNFTTNQSAMSIPQYTGNASLIIVEIGSIDQNPYKL